MGRRALLRFRARVDRYKFAEKQHIVAALLTEPAIAQAVTEHARAAGRPRPSAWERVRRYLDEIVPQFNVLAYYRFGYAVGERGAAAVLERDRGVRLAGCRRAAAQGRHRGVPGEPSLQRRLPARGVGARRRACPSRTRWESGRVRSRSSSSSSGSVRTSSGAAIASRCTTRCSSRTSQHITQHGVTQGIFPEGGLTRDGRLRPGKVGLLDYLLGVARDPAYRERLHLVPVALNYDRVLEDRTLLRELHVREGGARTSRRRQLAEVVRYAGWNVLRLATGRWRRYGRAAVIVGDPLPLGAWFAREDARAGGDLFALPREQRLGRVQALCDEMLVAHRRDHSRHAGSARLCRAAITRSGRGHARGAAHAHAGDARRARGAQRARAAARPRHRRDLRRGLAHAAHAAGCWCGTATATWCSGVAVNW